MRVEMHGIAELAADLNAAADGITQDVAKVTGKACNNIKQDIRRRWTGLSHLPHLPRSINYDVKTSGTTVTGEVGADHALTQGKLAWVEEYGTPTSAPHPAVAPAADKEVPVWESYLDKAAADVLEGTSG